MAPKPRASKAAAKPLATKGRAAAEQAEKPLFLPRGEGSSDSEPEGEPRPRQAPPKQSSNNVAPPSTRPVVEISSGSDHSEDEDLACDSDDDPVVREYDIFMTSELARNLYLFQYPVRSRQKPYTKAQNSCPVDARLKPKAGLVEVDIPVNVGVNFDQEKGRVWGDVLRKAQQAKESGFAGKAIGGPGSRGGKRRKVKGGDDEEEEEDDIMLVDFQEAVSKGRVLNTQTLGSKMQPDEARYMVGVFRNDQLHLTPVNSTLQLRPQFHHVDAQLAQERAQSKSLRDAEEAEKPSQARAIHMTVNQEVTQMSTTQKALRMAEEEDWKQLHWIDQDDDEAWNQYELLCLKDPELAGRMKCSTSKGEYMDWLSGAMMKKKDAGK